LDVELPDGVVIEGVPDGTSKVQLLGKLQLAKHPSAPALMEKMANEQALSDTSGIGKFNAGMGLAFNNIGRGAKQMLSLGSDYEANKSSDSALMHTGAGVAGNVAGNIAAFAPLSVVPGANTVAGAGVLGGVTAAMQPTDSTQDRLKNMLIGGGLGAGTQALAGPIATKVGEWGADREAAAAAKQSRNAVGDETLTRALDAGYAIPGSVAKPSITRKVIDSFGGKAAVGQQASIDNEEVTNKLARAAAGLSPDESISKPALRAVRQKLAAPYREIAAINPQSAADLEALQSARAESKLQWKSYGRSADPAAFKAAQAADSQVATLQANLEQAAQQAGKPQLVDAMKEARQALARNHEVQRALNVGSGNVDASVIGQALDRGAPLNGELETIGRFQQKFPLYAREGQQMPDVSKLSSVLSGALGAGGFVAGGMPGAAAAAIPFVVPPAARKLSLSLGSSYKPDYSVGTATKAAAALNDPETRRRVAILARALALPAIPQAVSQ
jgi:hypothetical protein